MDAIRVTKSITKEQKYVFALSTKNNWKRWELIDGGHGQDA